MSVPQLSAYSAEAITINIFTLWLLCFAFLATRQANECKQTQPWQTNNLWYQLFRNILTTKRNIASDCPVVVCFTYNTDVTASTTVCYAILIAWINLRFPSAEILLAKNVMTDKAFVLCEITSKQKRSTEGCSKFKSPETRQVQERLVSTLEHMQVPKWDRTRCPEE